MSYFVQAGTELHVFGGPTVAPTLDNVVAGNNLVLYLRWEQDSIVTPPTTPSGGWAPLANPNGIQCTGNPSYYTGAAIYILENAAAGSHTATITGGSMSAMSAQIAEFNTGVTASSLDKVAPASGATGSNTSGSSGTTATTTQANEIVLALIAGSGLNGSSNVGMVGPATSGYTNLTTYSNATTGVPGNSSYKFLSATGAQTAAWSWSVAGEYSTALVTIKSTAEVIPPRITSVSNITPNDGTNINIVGSGFKTLQTTGTAQIGSVAMTIISWSDTLIVATCVSGTNKYGPNGVTVTNSDGITSNAAAMTLLPIVGWAYVNLVTPNTTSAWRITAVADIASGDQLAYDTRGALVVVNNDATFVADPAAAPGFNVKAWTPSDWGTAALQTLVGSTDKALTGVAGTGAAQALTVSTGSNATVALTGVAGTGGVGVMSILSYFLINSVSATGQVGSLVPTISSNRSLTGVVGTSGVGSLAPHGSGNASLTGVAATGQAGALSPQDLNLVGVAATGQAGTVAGSSVASPTAVGVQALGQVASLMLAEAYTLLGVQAAGQVEALSSNVAKTLTGVQATGYAETILTSGQVPIPSFAVTRDSAVFNVVAQDI